MGFLNTTSNDSTSATMEYGNQLIQVLSKRLKLRLNVDRDFNVPIHVGDAVNPQSLIVDLALFLCTTIISTRDAKRMPIT